MRIEEKDGKLIIVDFNELEAYKVASTIEKDGIRFYENLIRKITDESVKESLAFLLEEENKHLAFFQKHLSRIGQTREDGFEEDDLLNYMEYGIFEPYQSMSAMRDIIDDVTKAIDLGIIVEDRTVKFYQACKAHVLSKTTKEELQHIIDEENRHKKLLEGILKS